MLYIPIYLLVNPKLQQMSTVNCLVIPRKDQEATNGVVHLIDGVLDPSVAMNRDVSEIISTVIPLNLHSLNIGLLLILLKIFVFKIQLSYFLYILTNTMIVILLR